jgi:hypothetical protein
MNHLKEIKYYELCMVCYVCLTTTNTDHDENKNPILVGVMSCLFWILRDDALNKACILESQAYDKVENTLEKS